MGSGVFLSNDSGRTWTAVSYGLSNPYVNCVAAGGKEVLAGTANGIFLSSDIVAGSDSSGAFFSQDNGASWAAFNKGVSDTVESVFSLAINDTTLYAGLSGGVWRRPVTDVTTGIREPVAQQPSGFSLSQNYPNPFNPSTAIGYRLSAASHVTLSVYDVLGRRVATLIDGKEGPGIYSVTFDADGLSSGVYLYTLKAGSYRRVMKMLLLK